MARAKKGPTPAEVAKSIGIKTFEIHARKKGRASLGKKNWALKYLTTKTNVPDQAESTQGASEAKRTGFLNLPPEIRNKIYNMALEELKAKNAWAHSPFPRNMLIQNVFSTKAMRLRSLRPLDRYKEPALLLASKQIRADARQMYYAKFPQEWVIDSVDSMDFKHIVKWIYWVGEQSMRRMAYLRIWFHHQGSLKAVNFEELEPLVKALYHVGYPRSRVPILDFPSRGKNEPLANQHIEAILKFGLTARKEKMPESDFCSTLVKMIENANEKKRLPRASKAAT